MTEDQLSKAEDLLRDPDSEDCERFASWYGADLIATVRRLQQPSRSEAQPSGYDGLAERDEMLSWLDVNIQRLASRYDLGEQNLRNKYIRLRALLAAPSTRLHEGQAT